MTQLRTLPLVGFRIVRRRHEDFWHLELSSGVGAVLARCGTVVHTTPPGVAVGPVLSADVERAAFCVGCVRASYAKPKDAS